MWHRPVRIDVPNLTEDQLKALDRVAVDMQVSSELALACRSAAALSRGLTGLGESIKRQVALALEEALRRRK